MGLKYGQLLRKPLISEKNFEDILIASTKILDDTSLTSTCFSIDSFDELYDFYQFVHPGSYSVDDLANAIFLSIIKLYYNSDEYIKDKVFEYMSRESVKHGGYNYIKTIQELQKNIKNSKLISFDNLNIAGGIGYFGKARFKRLLAGGLTILSAVPANVDAIKSAKSKDETEFTEQRKIKRIATAQVKKKWYQKLWDWTKSHVMPITIGAVSLLGLGCIGYVGYKDYSKRKKITDNPDIYDSKMSPAKYFAKIDSKSKLDQAAAVHVIKDKIVSQNESSAKSTKDILSTNRMLSAYGLTLGEQHENNIDVKSIPYGLNDRTYKLPDSIKVNVGGDKTEYFNIIQKPTGSNGNPVEISVSQSEINSKVDSLYGKEEDEKKKTKSGLLLTLSTVGSGLGMLWNIGNKVVNWFMDMGKKAGDVMKVIPESIEGVSRTMQMMDPRTMEYMFPKPTISTSSLKQNKWSADEILGTMKKYVKGQDEQLSALAKDLSAFIMKVRTVGNDRSEIDRMRQTVQRLLHVVGATGTGKSLMAHLVENILASAGIPCYRCNLTGWDDEKETIDAFLSKQKENESRFNSISNRPCLFIIEEFDKVCNTPDRARKVTTWIHNVFDSGKFGGGEESPGASMGLTYFLFTSNAIPSASDLKNKNVVGVDYSKGNYVELMDILSKTGGRSQPTMFHGSTQSRMWTIEMNEINEQSMPDVIESNLIPLCDNLFKQFKLDITWNKDCIKKMARTIHTNKYSSGGNRRIAGAVCNSVMGACCALNGLPADQIKRDEMGVAHYFLDFEGLDDEGNFKINLVDSKDKVKNEAKNIVIEDIDTFIDSRSPELENCITEEKISFLSSTLSILSDAIALDPNENWESLLSSNSINFIDELVSSLPEAPSIDSGLQIKFLVGSKVPLLESLKARKITDRQWESIKLLSDDVSKVMVPKINEARIKHQMEKGLNDLKLLLPMLKSLDGQAKRLGDYTKFSSLAESNKIAINDISSLFGKQPNESTPSDSLRYIMNSETVPPAKSMSKLIIKSISKLKNSVDSQLRSINDELSKNASIIISNFESIRDILKENDGKVDISKGFSPSDDKYLSSLVDKIEAGKSIPNTIEKLNYVLENIGTLKTYYNNTNGASDDEARKSTALFSGIENVITPKKIDVEEKVSIDPSVQSEFDSIFESAVELSERQDDLDNNVMDSFTLSRRALNALVSNDKYTKLKDKILEIGKFENYDAIISRLSEELAHKNVTLEEIIELRKSFSNAISKLPPLKEKDKDIEKDIEKELEKELEKDKMISEDDDVETTDNDDDV